ncbi:MAG: hypothetical protein NTW59_01260, partial [Candidatus Diapherotrites archaeon]|nr:hypothetical protein [Candidatus Diapherotrites archaeon]
QGGIPRGSSVLVSGGTGTCKTIFSMQFAYNGALLYSEPSLFVTIESNPKDIVWNMESFGWNINRLQEQHMLNIYRLKLSSKQNFADLIDEELDTINGLVREMKIKRLVVDSTTSFASLIGDRAAVRGLLFKFTDGLKDLDCTTILTAETKSAKTEFSAFGVEEFVADGIIALYFTPPNRSVFVRKMRGTAHDKNVHPFEITSEGIVVKPKEQVLWEAIK